jgi:hypothetical protein
MTTLGTTCPMYGGMQFQKNPIEQWKSVTGTTQQIVVGNGYIATAAGLYTATLPSHCKIGDMFSVTGTATAVAGWKVAQNAGQTIRSGASGTTTGVAGNMTGTANSAVTVVCVVANTDFVVVNSAGVLAYA